MARVLIIEDNFDLLTVLKQVVEMAGHTVTTASNGTDGQRAMFNSDAPPDIIICDVSLPDITGLELLRAVRADPRLKSVFFIAMSGDEDDHLQARQAGANQYLPKPFSINALTSMVQHHLEGKDS